MTMRTLKDWLQTLILYALGIVRALPTAPPGDKLPEGGDDGLPEDDGGDEDDPDLSGDDGPPEAADLGGTEFNADEEADVAEREAEDAEEEGEEDDDPAGDEDSEGSDGDEPPAEPQDEWERELAELSQDGEDDAQPTGNQPPTTPTTPVPNLPPPPQGMTWAVQGNQFVLIPLPLPNASAPTGPVYDVRNTNLPPDFDPNEPVTAQQFHERLAASEQRFNQTVATARAEMVREAEAHRQQTQFESRMEAHLDRFSLTRDKNSVMRTAVARAIASELPGNDFNAAMAMFDKTARRVTQQFYVERNAGRPRSKPGATAKTNPGKGKPKSDKRSDPGASKSRKPRPPRNRQDEIREEEAAVAEFLKKGSVRASGA
jgi:hypothetical protein